MSNKRYFHYVFYILLICMCVLLSRCAYRTRDLPEKPSEGLPRYHILGRGETLWRISKRYNVPLDEIIRYNNIEDVTDIPIGKKIYIPGKREYRWEPVPDFIWPLRGTITRRFNNSGSIHHTGIDILASEGTPIVAAASGEVIYNGNTMAGYGNMLIIKHTNGFSTVYAHNRRNLVRVGERIAQGQVVAEVGDTGRSSGHHLHFEIRKNEKPVNPGLYLPN